MKRHLALRFALAFSLVALLGARLPAVGAPTAPPSASPVVFAASSLTDALQELALDFGQSSGITVKLSFAASSALARQIESGAPADLFLSADVEWMDYLDTRHLVQSDTRRNLLGNRLVLIAPAASTVSLAIAPNFGLAEALSGGRLATGDPDSVPVGRYAQAALTSLGVWNGVANRLIRAENVRAALAFRGPWRGAPRDRV